MSSLSPALPPSLPYDLPGLLAVEDAGAPLIETGRSGMTGAHGVLVVNEGLYDPENGNKNGELRVYWLGVDPVPEMGSLQTSITGGTALNLQKPMGMEIGKRYLARLVGVNSNHGLLWAYTPGSEPDSVACWTLTGGVQGGNREWTVTNWIREFDGLPMPTQEKDGRIAVRGLSKNGPAALRQTVLTLLGRPL